MREILFRGKRADNNKWAYGFFFREAGEFIKELPSSVSTPTHLISPKTMGQFTGLFDKNGTRIFEGDIVKFNRDTSIGFVSWNDPNFMFVIKAKRNNFVFYTELKYFRDYEIIGNIYDNPELILEVNENA